MKLVNQQLIKNTNLKLLYNSVFGNRGISRAALAKQTGLSRTAVSSLVDELTERHFLYDSGTGSSPGVGRNPNCLELCSDRYYVAVFGWEEQAVHAHLVDISGSDSIRREIPKRPADSYLALCRGFLDHLPEPVTTGQLLGICFVLPAMIDKANQEVFSTSICLDRDGGGREVLPRIKEMFSDYPTAVLNDTACAAYAEKIYTRITEKDYAFIQFSQGIGATLFIQDRLLGDACAAHTQFGHFSISPQGPPCPCGNRGCLELMLGEATLADRLHQREPATYQSLGRAALYGDAEAMRVIKELAREFSIALSNLICLVHPALIVLGGKARFLGPAFLEEIHKSLLETGFRKMTENVSIRYSQLDSHACYNGAMKYFFDFHYQFVGDMEGAFFIG